MLVKIRYLDRLIFSLHGVLVFAFLVCGILPACAERIQPSCQIESAKTWTPQEKWTWRKLCMGKPAFLDQYYSGSIEPQVASKWPKERYLSNDFMRMILLQEPFRSLLLGKPVIVSGARFAEGLDLELAQVPISLEIFNSRFDQPISLTRFISGGAVIVANSYFPSLDASQANIPELVLQSNILPPLDPGEDASPQLDLQSIISNRIFIAGSIINSIDLSNSNISELTELENDQIYGDMNMYESNQNFLSIDSSAMQSVNMVNSNVKSGISGNAITVKQHFNIARANVGYAGIVIGSNYTGLTSQQTAPKSEIGDFEMKDTNVDGILWMESVVIDKDFGACCAEVGSIDLEGARVGQYLGLFGTHVKGDVDLQNIYVGSDGLLSDMDVNGDFNADDSKFCVDTKSVDSQCFLSLMESQFHDDVSISDSYPGSAIILNSAKVLGDVALKNLDFGTTKSLKIVAKGATIEGSVTISTDTAPGSLSDIDFSNSQIGSELELGSSSTSLPWASDSSINLENLKVSLIYDWGWSWPQNLDISNFQFDSIDGTFNNTDHDTTGTRFIKWLQLSPSFSPDSYDQLASYFIKNGQLDVANQILFQSRERDRLQRGWAERAILWVYKITVGYGYAPARAFVVAAVFIVIGIFVLLFSGQGRANGMPYGITFSFFKFLPLVPLEKRYEAVNLSGFVRYYFILHTLIGYVLAIFVVAALSDLVPKG